MDPTTPDISALARQLRKPEGDAGFADTTHCAYTLGDFRGFTVMGERL